MLRDIDIYDNILFPYLMSALRAFFLLLWTSPSFHNVLSVIERSVTMISVVSYHFDIHPVWFHRAEDTTLI